MVKSKTKKLPSSIGKLVKFFEAQDMGEFFDDMPEAKFEVEIKRKTHLFSLDSKIEKKLTEIAKSKHISPEKLINSWLKEKLSEGGEKLRERRLKVYDHA